MQKEQNTEKRAPAPDTLFEGRDDAFMDIDRMVNEGLGGGQIIQNATGIIDQSATDEMQQVD